jgi:hypothetical protein
VSAYIDEHRAGFGAEPICETLDVSASAYYERATGERSVRAMEDERLLERIEALHAANSSPMAIGGCGRRCSARASGSAAIASSA